MAFHHLDQIRQESIRNQVEERHGSTTLLRSMQKTEPRLKRNSLPALEHYTNTQGRVKSIRGMEWHSLTKFEHPKHVANRENIYGKLCSLKGKSDEWTNP